jgi:hypothetical protein
MTCVKKSHTVIGERWRTKANETEKETTRCSSVAPVMLALLREPPVANRDDLTVCRTWVREPLGPQWANGYELGVSTRVVPASSACGAAQDRPDKCR